MELDKGKREAGNGVRQSRPCKVRPNFFGIGALRLICSLVITSDQDCTSSAINYSLLAQFKRRRHCVVSEGRVSGALLRHHLTAVPRWIRLPPLHSSTDPKTLTF